MARLVKSGVSSITSIVIQTIKTDNSVLEAEYHIGELIKDLRYLEGQEIKTVTGKLSAINYNNLQVVRNYGVPSTVRSHFADDVIPVSIDIDCSKEYESNVVSIPCGEIIEDLGVENVKKMKCYMKYGVRFTSFLTNLDDNDFTIWEGQDIQGLIYMDRVGDVTSNVRVAAFTYDAVLTPLTMVVIENGLTKNIDIVTIKDMEAVIPVTNPGDDVSKAISESEAGMVCLGSGDFTSDITISKDTVIRGRWAGISAVERKNNPDSYGEETVVTGSITISDGTNLVLDGVTLSDKARIIVKAAENLELRNVVMEDLTPNGANTFILYTPLSETATKLTVRNCYFGNNGVDTSGTKMKNGFELTGPLADGSMIAGCYFEKECASNNIVCLYNAAEGAKITVRDNVFEYSANGIRVGTMGDVEVQYDLINNTYYETVDKEFAQFAGILLIQPYAAKTESMARNTIRLNGTKNMTDFEQLYYLYYGEKDTHMTNDILPTLIIDDVVVMAPTPSR